MCTDRPHMYGVLDQRQAAHTTLAVCLSRSFPFYLACSICACVHVGAMGGSSLLMNVGPLPALVISTSMYGRQSSGASLPARLNLHQKRSCGSKQSIRTGTTMQTSPLRVSPPAPLPPPLLPLSPTMPLPSIDNGARDSSASLLNSPDQDVKRDVKVRCRCRVDGAEHGSQPGAMACNTRP